MKIEIQHLDNCTPATIQAMNHLSIAVYPPATKKVLPIEFAPTTWRVLIWENGELVSLIGVITRKAMHNGTAVLLGGIGGVKTHPNARGKGYAGIGLKRAAEFMLNEQKVDFSLLVCRDELLNYYQKFGWQPFTGDLWVQQSSGHVIFTVNNPMVLAGTKPAPLTGTLDLGGEPW